MDEPRSAAALDGDPIRTISGDELRARLARGNEVRLIIAINRRACQERLGVEIRDCFVVGDAAWDLLAARRARMLSVGLLIGGYGADELLSARAFRVYRGADVLLDAIDELGI